MPKLKDEQLPLPLDPVQPPVKPRKKRSPKQKKEKPVEPAILPAIGFYVELNGKSGQIVKKLSRRNLILWESGEVSAMDDGELKAAKLTPGIYQPKDVPALVDGKSAIFKGEYSACSQICVYPPDSYPIWVDRSRVQFEQ